MNDLDAVLARLADAPLPLALDALEARVLMRIRQEPTARSGYGLGAVAIAAALTMGIFGAGISSSPAQANSPLSPLGPSSPLAPSTLLAGAP